MKASSNASPVKAGEIVSGRYRIERVLGAGGMGIVVLATDQRLGSSVAMKFLLPDALEHPEIVARFAREAQAAVKIRSEHVARVMDVGTLESGAPYMVMEYLEGHDLAAELAENGTLSTENVVDWVLQASEALAEAHRLGFVHRDMKPANLFLIDGRGAPIIKVLDFGISKTSAFGGPTGGGAAFTQTASLLGSPLYMSPEQMDSARNVDARTDVWALGVIFYELLAGTTPFQGESMPQLCMAILNQTPPSLRALRPDVPAKLEAVILRCLEKDRTRRFAGVEELAMALAEFAPPRSRLSLERIASLSGKSRNLSDSGRLGSGTSTGVVAERVTPLRRSSPNSRRESRQTPLGTVDDVGHETQATFVRTAAERRGPYFLMFAVGILVLTASAVVFLWHRGAQPAAPVPAASAAAALSSAQQAETPSLPRVEPQEKARPAEPTVIPDATAQPAATEYAPLVAAPPHARPKPPTPAAHAPAPSHPAHGTKPAESWEDER
jgi:serine/threonine-protein kinase